ncbi:serine/arginine-rich splicing factor 11-like [Myiozetetes cayanensis]|uniref:serine/arginine-rich splicing factor 11-like n=1 Tax=Myiozetetes cayanensis TaxID=478635 RepID=UPI00215EFC67|nr:serine/arginine-rich splicing factor 11-like [Myiozetetes cayanensis]
MMSSGGIGVPLGFPLGPTSVIQVTNVSSTVTSEQMRTLFGFLGDIEELRLYPPDNAPLTFSSKVCYIKFREASSVGVAQHLTNTVFIDRALIVVPCAEGKIPDEAKALSLLAPAPTMASLMPGAGLLPIPTPTPLTTLGVSLGTLGAIPAAALDPNITTLGEIPQPPIMGNVDPSKIDEIRRTVYVGNLNSQTTTADQLLEFFKQVGEVKFVRMAGDETQPTRFAFVEFADQNSVPRALAFNGVMFGDRPLKINHSNNAIVKPPEMTPQAAAKELEEVMKRVREAQSFISAAIEPESRKSSERKGGRSRSHSRSESRSSSKSQSRRKRSHSKHRTPATHEPYVHGKHLVNPDIRAWGRSNIGLQSLRGSCCQRSYSWASGERQIVHGLTDRDRTAPTPSHLKQCALRTDRDGRARQDKGLLEDTGRQRRPEHSPPPRTAPLYKGRQLWNSVKPAHDIL